MPNCLEVNESSYPFICPICRCNELHTINENYTLGIEDETCQCESCGYIFMVRQKVQREFIGYFSPVEAAFH